MKLNSLALRLFATAAVWAVLVLPAAGFIIDYVHKREVKQAFDGRLGQLLTLIIAFSTGSARFASLKRRSASTRADVNRGSAQYFL